MKDTAQASKSERFRSFLLSAEVRVLWGYSVWSNIRTLRSPAHDIEFLTQIAIRLPLAVENACALGD